MRYCILTNNNCNLNCDYCFQRGCKRNSTSISKEDVISFLNYIEKTNNDGRIIIDFLGGEPFLYKDVFCGIIDSTHNKINELTKNSYVSIFTNGTLCDDNIIQSILKIKNVRVVITQDISKNSPHRTCTAGKNYYDIIEGTIKKLKENNIKVVISKSIFSKSMILDYDNFLSKALEDDDFAISYAYATDVDSDFSYDDVLYMCDRFESFCNKNNIIRRTEKWNNLCCRVGLDYISSTFELDGESLPFIDKNDCLESCMPYINELAISPKGYVIPCSKALIIEDEFSNAHISTFNSSVIKNRFFKTFDDRKIEYEKCSSCKMNAMCNVCDIICSSNGEVLKKERKCERAKTIAQAQIDHAIKMMKKESQEKRNEIFEMFQKSFNVFELYNE